MGNLPALVVGWVDMVILGAGKAIPEEGKAIPVEGKAIPEEGKANPGMDIPHLVGEDTPAAALQRTPFECSDSFFQFTHRLTRTRRRQNT